MAYEVELDGAGVERVPGADAYRQEGQLLTFYRTRPGRDVIDCWATPVASYRTSKVLKVVLLDDDVRGAVA